MDFKAAIFDLDGTLVDSYKSWEFAYQKALAAVGHDLTECEFTELYHMTPVESHVFFKKIYDAKLASNTVGAGPKSDALTAASTNAVGVGEFETFVTGVYKIINDEMRVLYGEAVEEKPRALEYVKSLFDRGVPVCVATLTQNCLSRAALERLGFTPYLRFIITSEDIGLSKKHPDIFLEAARRLGFSPPETAVFEDCPTALQTARKAGFMVCGVADRHRNMDVAELSTYCDWSVINYADELDKRGG